MQVETWALNQWPADSLEIGIMFERARRNTMNGIGQEPRLATSDRAVRRDMMLYIVTNAVPAGQG